MYPLFIFLYFELFIQFLLPNRFLILLFNCFQFFIYLMNPSPVWWIFRKYFLHSVCCLLIIILMCKSFLIESHLSILVIIFWIIKDIFKIHFVIFRVWSIHSKFPSSSFIVSRPTLKFWSSLSWFSFVYGKNRSLVMCICKINYYIFQVCTVCLYQVSDDDTLLTIFLLFHSISLILCLPSAVLLLQHCNKVRYFYILCTTLYLLRISLVIGRLYIIS